MSDIKIKTSLGDITVDALMNILQPKLTPMIAAEAEAFAHSEKKKKEDSESEDKPFNPADDEEPKLKIEDLADRLEKMQDDIAVIQHQIEKDGQTLDNMVK